MLNFNPEIKLKTNTERDDESTQATPKLEAGNKKLKMAAIIGFGGAVASGPNAQALESAKTQDKNLEETEIVKKTLNRKIMICKNFVNRTT